MFCVVRLWKCKKIYILLFQKKCPKNISRFLILFYVTFCFRFYVSFLHFLFHILCSFTFTSFMFTHLLYDFIYETKHTRIPNETYFRSRLQKRKTKTVQNIKNYSWNDTLSDNWKLVGIFEPRSIWYEASKKAESLNVTARNAAWYFNKFGPLFWN